MLRVVSLWGKYGRVSWWKRGAKVKNAGGLLLKQNAEAMAYHLCLFWWRQWQKKMCRYGHKCAHRFKSGRLFWGCTSWTLCQQPNLAGVTASFSEITGFMVGSCKPSLWCVGISWDFFVDSNVWSGVQFFSEIALSIIM